ncbi:hypothetical protein [Rhodococcus maanshanensis]|uniref:Uncharacterized protein n=1 Tax=Rhodococcus maanshanensis TaxID=183556 RepID=A0A1H7RB99_9NOCA|nr:hypothetical protein [Rhodococcus maanshanensis]SEL57258.1 hypothetical protein SAMN05444583_11119 [Rhodococcus maanshanensis]
MTRADERPIPLSTRVNRLFEWGHRRGDPEQTNEEVALALGERLRRPIEPRVVESLRDGSLADPPLDLRDAVADHFEVARAYLSCTDYGYVDTQVRLCISARDAGVRSLSMRSLTDPDPAGGTLPRQAMEELIGLLARLGGATGDVTD